MDKQTTLKERLRQDRLLVAPCCYDMISAKLIEQAGFEAVYLGGYAHVASHLGLPDAGLATFSEMLERVHNLARCVEVPILADGDTGYGNALNMRRTVQEYEQAGAQAIQVEDQEMPKKCGHTPGKRLIEGREMALKIEAAVEARRSDDFVIIARTDALAVNGLADAVERGKLYEQAGADVIFLEAPTTIDELKVAAGSFGVPTMANMIEGGKTPFLTTSQLEELGFRIAAYPHSLILTCLRSIQKTLVALKEQGTTQSIVDEMADFDELDQLIGFPEARAWEARYTPAD
ncbi:MAG: carboxyvinyl-carboxyphosphonate phosphorylmutase [Candidatus Latescibacteria bacterium]|nr:carboxyvinyl-carboxyphosphonate phosphorylmutase [Candidatus Latescibacterota bacterium]